MMATATNSFKPSDGQQWLQPGEARLPTVMSKAVERAVASSAPSGEIREREGLPDRVTAGHK
jgi:hypothetical protein